MFHYCTEKNWILLRKWMQRCSTKHSFVANFVIYICAKYYLNWFSFHIAIMKVIGVNFFETLYMTKRTISLLPGYRRCWDQRQRHRPCYHHQQWPLACLCSCLCVWSTHSPQMLGEKIWQASKFYVDLRYRPKFCENVVIRSTYNRYIRLSMTN